MQRDESGFLLVMEAVWEGYRGMGVGFSKEEAMANDCKDRRKSGQNELRRKEV